MVGRLFLAVPRGCLQFVIVVFPDHAHLLFFYEGKLGQSGDGILSSHITIYCVASLRYSLPVMSLESDFIRSLF